MWLSASLCASPGVDHEPYSGITVSPTLATYNGHSTHAVFNMSLQLSMPKKTARENRTVSTAGAAGRTPSVRTDTERGSTARRPKSTMPRVRDANSEHLR